MMISYLKRRNVCHGKRNNLQRLGRRKNEKKYYQSVLFFANQKLMAFGDKLVIYNNKLHPEIRAIVKEDGNCKTLRGRSYTLTLKSIKGQSVLQFVDKCISYHANLDMIGLFKIDISYSEECSEENIGGLIGNIYDHDIEINIKNICSNNPVFEGVGVKKEAEEDQQSKKRKWWFWST